MLINIHKGTKLSVVKYHFTYLETMKFIKKFEYGFKQEITSVAEF